MFNVEMLLLILENFIWIVILLTIGWVITIFTKRGLYKFFKIDSITEQIESNEEKTKITLVKLVASIIQYIIWFLIFSILLSNIRGGSFIALLTGFGVTVSFLIRDFVVDVITGIFVLGERQFQVGDVIIVQNQKGTVIEIGMRTTKLLLEDNSTFICANRLVTSVTVFPVYSENEGKGE